MSTIHGGYRRVRMRTDRAEKLAVLIQVFSSREIRFTHFPHLARLSMQDVHGTYELADGRAYQTSRLA